MANGIVSRLRLWLNRGIIVSGTAAIVFASRFLLNVILSRLLAPHEFGLATSINLVLGFSGLATDVALDRFVMVNRSPEALSAAHLILIIRGTLLALVLAIFAEPISALFGVSQFAGSFALVAFAPFLYGFEHVDIQRLQTDFNYRPSSVAQLLAIAAMLAATLTVAFTLHDHLAIIAGFLAFNSVHLTLSHLFATTPYGIRSDKEHIKAALFFVLPLTLNGIALAISSQLDRVIVGSLFGVVTLGLYSVILNLGIMPISLILRILGTLGLPYLLSTRDALSTRLSNYRSLVFVHSLLSVAYAVLILVVLDFATPLIFGPSFKVSHNVQALVAIISFLRLQRGGAPTTFLLATARTSELAFFNLTSLVGLGLGLYLSILWHRIDSMLLGVAIGDLIVFILLFFASSARIVSRQPAVLFNFAIAFSILAGTIAIFLAQPTPTLQTRGLLVLVGLVGLGLQFSTGLKIHLQRSR